MTSQQSAYHYTDVVFDMFAVGHYVYHSLMRTKRENDEPEHLSEVSFPKANAKKDGNVYAEMALSIIRIVESEAHKGQNKVLCLFDNATSKSQARTMISETYKSNRSKMPTTFYRTMDFVQFFLSKCALPNVYVARVPKREADDLIKTLLENSPNEFLDTNNAPILLITNDSDWYACLGYDTKVWWFLNKDEFYTQENFVNEYGFQPSFSSVAVYKALLGDKADNIDGIIKPKDLPHDKLIEIVEAHSSSHSPESLPASVSLDSSIPVEVRNKIKEERSQYLVNLKLTDAIDTSMSRIRKYTWQSENNSHLRAVIEKALYGVLNNTPPQKKFTFGGVSVNV